MQQQRVPFQRIAFVCLNRRVEGETCCAAGASEPIFEALKAQVKAGGLTGRVRVSRSGCQDVCAQGPNVMVFPDYVWFHHVTLDDVPRIVAWLNAPASEAAIVSPSVVTVAGDAEPGSPPPARRRPRGMGGQSSARPLTPAAEDGRRGGAAAGPATVTTKRDGTKAANG